MEVDTFLYSSKSAARELCAPLQNKIVTKGVARTIKGEKVYALADYGYGKAQGCLGINCGHYLTPFIVGLNYKPDLPEELKELDEKQAIKNANAQAKQRAFEREIRKSKELINISKIVNDKELEQKHRLRVKTLQSGLKQHIEKNPFLYRDKVREKGSRIKGVRKSTNEYVIKRQNKYMYIKESEIPTFKKKVGKITKKERSIIYASEPKQIAYIRTPHSFEINEQLRNGKLANEYTKVVDTLDNVLHKNNIHKNIKVHRFDDKSYLNAIIEYNQHLLADYNNIDDILNSKKAKFANKGYTSTSYIPKYNYFKDRPIKTIINIPKNSKIYFTDNDDESEIIIPRGAKYDIIGMKRNSNGTMVIEMNLVGDKK